MTSQSRRIIHIDMDAFYASVEQRDTPALRRKPVAVGGHPGGRGVVAAASYEARAFGVHSAMSMAKALKICPELQVVSPNFKKYREISRQVFELFLNVTPLVEPLSLDEAYLDVTENTWGEQLATTVARRLKDQITSQTGLTASAGIAPNKFLAKVASGWRKPDGLTVVHPDRIELFLHQLPVNALWGVGPVTEKKLRSHGIERLVDMREIESQQLLNIVGKQGHWLKSLSYGEDNRPVTPNRRRKSFGSEHTFPKDLVELMIIRKELERMVEKTTTRLCQTRQFAHTITIKVRYSDFTTVTRSETKTNPTRDTQLITDRSLKLLKKTEAGQRPVRLLGITVSNLTETTSTEPGATPRNQMLWRT